MNLDDLLNSALDELETQEKEQPTTTKTTTTTTTTTTSNTTKTINNNNNTVTPSTIKPTYNKPPPPSLGNDDLLNTNVNDMMDIFKKLLGEETLKNLDAGFDKEYNKDINNNSDDSNNGGLPSEEDKKKIDELAEKLATMFGVSEDSDLGDMDNFKPFLEELTKAGGLNFNNDELNNNSNNNNKNNNNSGVHIDNFESSISDTLKNLADNASNKTDNNGGIDDLFSNLSKLMEGQNFNLDGEETGQINDLFEESIQFMAENYPDWIEKNIDHYPPEETERFKNQSEIFSMIAQQKEGEADMLDSGLLARMSQLGNLPDSFCEDSIKKVETEIDEKE
ncbi:peroxin 19 [Dictyostelium discoideum AX4]|uniref:Putative peroxisomal biogenesis factor 19 n=1 Tax=Dictyostelium discoideum TaxID=44689 RepID=PEX19_DICDI|nr:peroxin 19 [Dictyostelium discoideum AX4]Q555I0.1 RecName: Full=Putative peroxisomal biogenesis factor 19; AltName: Full=Peroxin-19 [Dictyostelium discoideum]EAL70329.1 peroxin 19 [Dictyostelium discoideum AX4]|eukprot:XP_644089.1 peroxin 19 [Dictyostelium discoideum AX4]